MMSARLASLISIGGAVLAPLFCFAHGTEFILAHLDTTTPGIVTVKLTADYGANPMIQSEEDARRILPDCLHVRQHSDIRAVPLSTLGAFTFAKQDAPDPDAPLPPDPLAIGVKHEILAATLHWHTDATSLRFEVSRSSKHDVLLWRKSPEPQGSNAEWQILLGGDQSSDIPLPARRASNHLLLYLALSTFLIALLLLKRWFKSPDSPR